MNDAKLLRWWIALCAIAGAALFVSQLWEIPWRSALRGYDNTFNYLWLRSALADGDWDFENDLQIADTLAPEHQVSALGLPRTKSGRIPNKYGVGWAVLTAPAYVAADALVIAGERTGAWTWPRDGFGPVYQIAVQCWHLVLALLSLVLAWKTIARWLDDSASALAGVTTVWAASPLFYYQTANLSMSHGAAFFAIALFAFALTRARDGNAARWWVLAGLGWGLAVITRFQLAVFGIVALWAWATTLPARGGRESGKRNGFAHPAVRAASYFSLGAAPLLFLQLWAWRVVYGEWFVFSYGAEGETFHWIQPEIFNSLFSSWHGLFYWHPLLAIAAIGMVAWAWRDRGEALAWALTVGATAYIAAAWWCWWFASSFGNRAYDAALLPLMGGTAWLFSRVGGTWRGALWTLAIVAGLWNFYVATLYRTGAISRHEPVTWKEMLAAAHRLPDAARFEPRSESPVDATPH